MKLLMNISDRQWQKMVAFIRQYLLKPTSIVAILFAKGSLLCLRKAFIHNERNRFFKIKALINYCGVILSLSVLNRKSGTVRELRLYFDPWLINGLRFHESNIIVFF